MKKIIAKDRGHLERLIQEEIKKNGNTCNLNHIDLSYVVDLTALFFESSFNGDISKWDVSKVENMYGMFKWSIFNGDISKWDVSKVRVMSNMFEKSPFNGDISGWNVSHVEDMDCMFYGSQFDKDLSGWNNMGLANMKGMFDNCVAPKPWWYVEINDKEARIEEVRMRREVMNLNKKLEQGLVLNNDMKDLKEKKVFKL